MVNIYQVGGSVRDSLLNKKSKDIDYAVEAPAYTDMKHYILDKGGEIFLETPGHFTIRAKMPELGSADFVLCRKEYSYSDHRHPDLVEPGTLYDDLSRRDFTMNAMAIDIKNPMVLIDPFNGQVDVKNKLIRCVGNARDRILEDPLRLLRAFRFAVVLDFDIDDEILDVIDDTDINIAQLLTTSVSEERVREELYKMFKYNTLATLQLLSIYEDLTNSIFSKTKIWLEPTMREK
jgi:tRNA nucleotidyltransferase/poly(A) polymerase